MATVVFLVSLFIGFMASSQSQRQCQNGVSWRDCSRLPNLCSKTTCPNYPNAECSMNSCAGCRPEFKMPNDLSPLHPKECKIAVSDRRCQNAREPSNCDPSRKDSCKSSNDCSPGTMCCRTGCIHECINEIIQREGVCPVVVEGLCSSTCDTDNDCARNQKCCPNECGSSCQNTVPESTKTCPDGSKEVSCSKNPCNIRSCNAFPSAECRPNLCGGCNAEFFDAAGKSVDCEFLGPECSNCFVNPCDGLTCKAFKDAECRPNWCDPNPCSAKFYIDNQEINCDADDQCPNGQPPNCNRDPCQGAICAGNSNAKCVANRCECTAEFFDDQNNVVDCTPPPPRCPDGSRPDQCNPQLCNTKDCPNIPTAQCRPNPCKNCEIEFFVGGSTSPVRDVDCIKQDPCPPGTPQAACQGRCLGRTCPAVEGAECIVNGCGGCSVKFYNKDRKELTAQECGVCPDWSLELKCDGNPCGARCEAFPRATCTVNRCGSCRGIYRFNGQVVDCTPPRCPDGSRPEQCNPQLCNTKDCPNIPTAQCRPNPCKKCEIEFFVGGSTSPVRDVDCIKQDPCPPGTPQAGCQGRCLGRTCPAVEGAECIVNGCGGCSVKFYNTDRKELTAQECGVCPDWSLELKCDGNPCGARCEAFPRATCTVNRCGSCRGIYRFNGRVVDCKPRTCTAPDGSTSTVVQCNTNPCTGAKCPANPNANCRPNTCGKCSAQFFDNRNRLVDCTPPRCPGGSRPDQCNPQLCNTKDCPNIPTAQCRPNPCKNCEIEFFVGGSTSPVRDVDCIKREPCPPGSPLAKCVGNCLGRTCPKVPTAQCIINGCGGCTVKFYNKDRKELSATDCGVCPNWNVPNTCRNPCANAVCRSYPNAQCSFNACESCNPIHTVNGVVVDCNICKDGKVYTECKPRHEAACRASPCPGVANAKCITDPCDSCSVSYTSADGNTKLTDAQCSIISEEKPGTCVEPQRRGSCSIRCRSDSSCFGNRKCCSNGCGMSCQTPSFTCPGGGRLLTCQPFNCLFASCPAHPDAECRPNRCSFCIAEFYNRDGKLLSDDECKLQVVQPDGCPVSDYSSYDYSNCQATCISDAECSPNEKCCLSNICFARVCTSITPVIVDHPGTCPSPNFAGCLFQSGQRCSNDGDCAFTEKCCFNGCRNTCQTVTGSSCTINCFINPCTFARCSNVPGAVCRSECCKAIWSVNGIDIPTESCSGNPFIIG